VELPIIFSPNPEPGLQKLYVKSISHLSSPVWFSMLLRITVCVTIFFQGKPEFNVTPPDPLTFHKLTIGTIAFHVADFET
jgi:hypothetical protein